MPILPLFPTDAALPAPLTAYDPAMALPDFAARVEKLRRWQASIASGYVTTQKEEALQAEFLNLVFGQALGYEHERPDYRQLLLEKKTNVDGTKPDGALGQFAADPKGALAGPVRAVVELKDARTQLDAKQKLGAKGRAETPVEQAFSYPSKMGASCRWVLVSNFVELRLYAANDQTRAEVFDFRTMPDQPAALRRFFALLAAGQLLPLPAQADAPLDLALRQRQEQEARISKDFYRDYRAARRALLDHLIEQNPAVEPLALLGHTQKLLDRVIFVCFCEDKNIIPRLTFRRLLDAVRANVFDPADDKIYRTVRGLFQSIDRGNPAANINRFNGGLFAPDAALDALVIKDRTLEPAISLEKYDFASELNVNILGHIFEQSLADLEAERARLAGAAAPTAKQGKRKQDGIFYTPDYITRYIVGQAVGGWLRERRDEAGLDALPELTDADRATIRMVKTAASARLGAVSPRVQKHIDAWETYGQRLRRIRVLDPACGSGAFLNEAFGYLLREGEVVNAALAELRAGQREVFALDRHILQHNLYGVDLNPESVQITRLSLWLQTANPGRPLTSLDHSIRTGNSLIADPAVAGDRAFDWHQEFPEAFADGGFDVVVGNPPYVRSRGLFSDDEKSYLTNRYKTSSYQLDLYKLFIELAIDIAKSNGFVAFITPSVFLNNEYDKKLREYLLTENHITDLTFPAESVFDDAEVKTVVFNIKKSKPVDAVIAYHIINKREHKATQVINQNSFQGPKFIINETASGDSQAVTQKLEIHPKLSYAFIVKNGMKVRKELLFDSQATAEFKAFVLGKDVSRYSIQNTSGFVHYTSQNEKLYTNQAFRTADAFEQPKLIVRQIPGKKYLFASLDVDDIYADQTTYLISNTSKDTGPLKYLLTLLSSKLLKFYFDNVHSDSKETFPKVKRSQLLEFPIPNITPAEQQPFIDLAEQLLSGHRALHAAEATFATLLRAELGLTAPLTGKLALTQEWKAWSTALAKALGRPLSLPEKSEWLPYYAQHQQQQAAARQHLARLDADLDGLVYQLYGLSEAEIALVAGGGAA